MVIWEYCGIELRWRPYRLLWVQEWYEAVAVSPDGRTRGIAHSEPFVRPALGPEGLSTRQEKVFALQDLVSRVVGLGWQLLPSIDDRMPRFRRTLTAPAAIVPAGDAELDEQFAAWRTSMEGETPRPEASQPTAPPALETLLARIEGFHQALGDYEQRFHERESSVRDQESRAAQQLSEAQLRAAAMIEQAQRQATDLGEALQRALAAEQQLAERHAALAQREHLLQERETQLAQATEQFQAERLWLQQYAQTIAHVVGELERALNVSLPAPSSRRLTAGGA